MQNYRPFRDAQALSPVAGAAVLPFVRRVYLLLTLGIIIAAVGGLVALYAGTPVALPSGTGRSSSRRRSRSSFSTGS